MKAVKKRVKKIGKVTLKKNIINLFQDEKSYIPYNIRLIQTLLRAKGNTLKEIEEALIKIIEDGSIVMFCIDDTEYLTQSDQFLEKKINRKSSLPVRSEFREIVEIDHIHEKVLLYKVGIVTLLITEGLILRQFLLHIF